MNEEMMSARNDELAFEAGCVIVLGKPRRILAPLHAIVYYLLWAKLLILKQGHCNRQLLQQIHIHNGKSIRMVVNIMAKVEYSTRSKAARGAEGKYVHWREPRSLLRENNDP